MKQVQIFIFMLAAFLMIAGCVEDTTTEYVPPKPVISEGNVVYYTPGHSVTRPNPTAFVTNAINLGAAMSWIGSNPGGYTPLPTDQVHTDHPY